MIEAICHLLYSIDVVFPCWFTLFACNHVVLRKFIMRISGEFKTELQLYLLSDQLLYQMQTFVGN